MDDSHATLAAQSGFGEETRDLVVRFMPVEAVQIGVILDGPAASTQITQHAAWQTGAQEGVTDRQQIVDLEGTVQGFNDDRRVVEFALAWARAGLGGLKGDAIPISARLMALADVYDALISRRVYKPAFSHEQACATIVKGRGSHFDPDIADAFVELAGDFLRISQRYPDPE